MRLAVRLFGVRLLEVEFDDADAAPPDPLCTGDTSRADLPFGFTPLDDDPEEVRA